MKDSLEHLSEDSHFALREKMQSELIRDFYHLGDADKVTNAQAYAWLKPNAALFDAVFKKTVEEHPSFYDDAENDFTAAIALVQQKLIEEEKEHPAM